MAGAIAWLVCVLEGHVPDAAVQGRAKLGREAEAAAAAAVYT